MNGTIPTDAPHFDYETRFKEIADFLKQVTPIWQDEVLHSYPQYNQHYPETWVQDLDQLTEEQLYLVDARLDYGPIQNSPFYQIVEKIHSLSFLPSKSYQPDHLPSWAFNRVKEKKQHEIGILAKYVSDLKKQHQFRRVTDIGGGVGHLARVLSYYYGFNFITIDRDQDLQEMGKKRLEKYPKPDGGGNVQYLHATFGDEDESQLQQISEAFSGEVMTIGLHTCGPLAVEHLNRSMEKNSKLMLNFGCCYNKLSTEKDVNLSKLGKEFNLTMTDHALTLASRGHNKMTFDDYRLKTNVKKFRYTLHLLLYQKFGIKEFLSAGEVHPRVYRGEFSDYALNKLEALGIEHELSGEDLEQFFRKPAIEKEVRKMFICNIIRWQMGRLMEVYLLIDRLLWLQENGYSVDLSEYFDPELSPRNIGLTAFK